MSDQDSETAEWLPLPKGELRAFAARHRATERRRLVSRVAAVVLLSAGLAGGIYWQFDRQPIPQNDPVHAGIACSVVRSELPLFVNGALTESRMQQIRQHLTECPPCERIRIRLLSNAASPGVMTPTETQVSGSTGFFAVAASVF